MILTIDGAGRVVIPKRLRDKFGMRAGSALDLLETPDGIILKPVESLARKGRFLVFTGEVPEGWDVVKAIEEEREAQDRKTSDIGLSHKPGRCVMEATAGI